MTIAPPHAHPAREPASAPASLGGYRLVRVLGAGPRATVHLGHVDGHPQVALKEFAAAVPTERIEREAEALMRAAGDHVVKLVDLALDARGRPALLLERIAGPSLSALLGRRRRIRPGEAVTILAPLAATVARLHRDGVVHAGLDPGSVLFTESGSPTLVGFGDAELLDLEATGRAPVAQRAELLARDAAALARLVQFVLDATRPTSASEADALQLLRGLAGEEPKGHGQRPGFEQHPGYAERLEAAVFDLAEPEPVDLDASAGPAASYPERLTGAPAGPGGGGGKASRGMLLDGFQVPEWLRGMLGPDPAARLSRLRSAVSAVRRPFWVAGGVAAVALTTALLLTPSAEPAPQTDPQTTSALPVGAQPGAGSADPSAAEPSTAERAVLGDDPAAAATALLGLRAECFRELSVLCLDSVDQADSSAAVADTSAILAAQEGGQLEPDGVIVEGNAEVVERLGDTALVRIAPPEGAPDAEPASVLVIRTEAGWRIRGFPSGTRSAPGG